MDFFVPSLKKSGESWRVSDGNLLCAAARATSGCSRPCDGEMKKTPCEAPYDDSQGARTQDVQTLVLAREPVLDVVCGLATRDRVGHVRERLVRIRSDRADRCQTDDHDQSQHDGVFNRRGTILRNEETMHFLSEQFHNILHPFGQSRAVPCST